MTNGPKKLGVTPAKAVLIAVLGIALVAVWGPQLIGGSDAPSEREVAATPEAPRRAPQRRSPRRQRATTASRPTDQPTAPERTIPTLTLSEATAHDPFAVPAWALAPEQIATSNGGQPAPTGDELQQRFDSLRATGVGMVLVSGDGQAVQIGKRTVRVGDEIDGFRVVEITRNNVVFKPALAGEGGDSGT